MSGVSRTATVYLSERATNQKSELATRWSADHPDGTHRAYELFDGITSFLAKDPFSFESTENVKEYPGYFITKSYTGIEPYTVTILFSEMPENGRRLEAVRIRDKDDNHVI